MLAIASTSREHGTRSTATLRQRRDNAAAVPTAALGRQSGVLLDAQEPALTSAIRAAFDLERSGIKTETIRAWR